jgi:hypothetical protein
MVKPIQGDTMASLIITTGENAGVTFKLDQHLLIGGREANRDIQLLDPKVSRRHFVVRPEDDSYVIVEQTATNGVYINGQRIAGKARSPTAIESSSARRSSCSWQTTVRRASMRASGCESPPPRRGWRR